MMRKTYFIGLIVLNVLFVTTSKTFAQENSSKFLGGNSVNVMIPQGTLAETYNIGWGIYADFEYNFGKHLAACFDLGWNKLMGPDTTYIDDVGDIITVNPDMSVWDFSLGLKASISVLYIEAKGGYFTGINKWGFIPAVGLRLGKFDIQGNYTMAGENKWIGARIGFYWGG